LVGFNTESRSFNTKKEAKTWAEEREEELRRRRLGHPDLLIDELVGVYLKDIAPKRRMAKSHAKHDVPSFRKRLRGLTLSGLTGNGLSRWVLSNTDVSASTRNWHLCRLYGVLKQVEQHVEVKIPWEDMDACRKKLKQMGYIEPAGQRDRRLTDAEIAAIKSKFGREVTIRMKDIVDFCVASCMRIGEVTRIRWQDLDEQARTIVVRDRKHPTKKFGNHCVVPLLGGSFEILTRQPRRDDRVFPHNPLYLSIKFKDAARAAGVQNVVLHDLRHEGITRLFELGFQIQEVAMVSGHTNWRVLRRYVHLRPQSLVDRERVLREAQKKTASRDAFGPLVVPGRAREAERQKAQVP
jgi:integrase